MTSAGSSDIIARLKSVRQPGPAALAFDADGTLWSGDVGEDTFECACRDDALKLDGRAALAKIATEHGVSSSGSTAHVAEALYAGYKAGVVTERLMCEVMTICYSGYTEDSLRELASGYLTSRGLPGRARTVLIDVIAWARREGIRCVVISASPTVIVKEGLRLAGIRVDDVGGAVAKTDAAGLILPEMAAPLPYGPQKCVVGQRLLEGFDWLASFGDNAFDVDMMCTARSAFAIFPKPALVARLSEVPNVVVVS